MLIISLYCVFIRKLYLTSVLNTKSGFFSMFFFTLNHAIYATENHLNFKIDSSDWLFKFKHGWTDYFEPYELSNQIQIIPLVRKHDEILAQYSIREYKQIIPHIYKYNKTVDKIIQSARKTLNLIDTYDSIFIRRGDKIISGESRNWGVEKYIDLLFVVNPLANKVYIQTDDYSVIEEVNTYLKKINRRLDIKTLCDKSQRGVIVFKTYKNVSIHVPKGKKEEEYVEKNKIHYAKNKSVEDMNPNEIYNHTITMITGIDIVCKSNVCICDYESNVGRFIKLFHNDSSKVHNILDPDNDIDYSKRICPAFSF